MGISVKYRTREPEIMDDFLLEGEELREALDKIAGINKLLGGNKLTLDGVKELLKKADKSREIIIADIGCGNGDMLRVLADYAAIEGWKLKLLGLDANPYTIEYARKLSAEYRNIEYQCMDIFTQEFEAITYDVLLCTLTLHHFEDDEIVQIMAIFNRNARIGVVVNDLHRSKTAYKLFKIICKVFSLNRMSREDGLTSILRGFRKRELETFSEKLGLKNYSIRWKWAFRYQWIISKI